MKLVDSIKNYIRGVFPQSVQIEPQSSYMGGGYGGSFSQYYEGENTPYELGTPIDYELDYQTLRLRAWESYLKSDIIQNAIRKYILWITGAGLKLQSDPQTDSKHKPDFIKQVEKQFRLFADINESTYNEMQSLHEYGSEALKTAMLSGDCLCINRYENGIANIELIDGCFLNDPLDGGLLTAVENRGNKIVEGVEINKKGTHIAYFVQQDDYTHIRIPAKGVKTGRKQAWLFHGLKYKLNDVRGMSLLTAVLETVKKLDRYKSATVGNAEENSKIPFTIEHDQNSTGENPMINQLAQSYGKGKAVAPETGGYDDIDNVKSKIAVTTNKQVYNMPIGSTLKRNDFETDMNFAEFWGINESIVYYTLGIPPEVAKDLFGGSYSSSRAALKSWEYKMFVDRKKGMTDQFYRPFYEFWLDVNVINGNINAPEYLTALLQNNLMELAAWRRARFIGASVPHIDPLKEVKASRAKLGSLYDRIPLTTADTETEILNTEDFGTIIEKAEKELENAEYFEEEEQLITE